MAQQSSPLKILAVGSPLSALSTLVAKVTAINAKHGPFDACVIVGDLFKEGSDGSELDGIQLPVPTYFAIGKYALPQPVQDRILGSGGEIAPNLVFLGKAAVLTTAQGLKLCCVGGKYDATTYDAPETDPMSPTLSKSSISSLLSHALLNPHAVPEETLASARTSAVALPPAFQGIDLLLMTSPPPHLSMLSPSFTGANIDLADLVPPLSGIVERARPRYMFWSEGEGFWEREPWGWGTPGQEDRWTRAVKLGPLGALADGGEGKKARWFYAFTLPPQTPSSALPIRPTNASPNPLNLAAIPNTRKRAALDDQDEAFEGENKRAREAGDLPEGYVCNICGVAGHRIQDCPQKNADRSKPPAGYVCKLCQSTEHFIKDCPNKAEHDAQQRAAGPRPPPPGYVCRACGMRDLHFIKDCPVVAEREGQRNKKKELGPAECWFCLSNPKVTKHLIVAIGTETYVTLPKGQLIPTLPRHLGKDAKGPLVPGGGHVLIIPIAHHPTLLSIPAEDALPIISEIESYKSSLRKCYESYGAVPVTFEVGRLSGRGGHAHVQIIPVPKELGGQVAGAFRALGDKQGIDWEEEPEKALAKAGGGGNYFKVECPDGSKMVHLLKGQFDLQFGRMVLAGLLGLHHRFDWKECVQTDEEDKKDAQDFKKAFAPFHS